MSDANREDSSGVGPGSHRRQVFDPEALFRALADAEVDYVLIGGLAVAAHGAVRATADLDICPDPDHPNLQRLAHFLDSVDAVSADEGAFDADEFPARDLEGLRRGGNFRLRTRLGALDLMQYVEPFADGTWSVLDKHAEERRVFGMSVRVCSYEDLLEMKAAAGREQDLIDIESLKAAQREL